MTLRETVASGELLASLEATRDQIAADLEVCESMRDRAALYLRLTDVLTRIEQVKPAKPEGDVIDEVASRRAARRASAS